MAKFSTKISKLVIPAKAGIHFNQSLRWIPAFARMTNLQDLRVKVTSCKGLMHLKKQSLSNERLINKQAGVVLFFALIALVVMSLAAVALIRSADTGGLIAGNLSFKQSTLFSADRGAESSMKNWLLKIGSDLSEDNPDSGYYASISDVNADTIIDNNKDARQLVDEHGFDDGTDASGNQISYVIQRMCPIAGVFVPGHGVGVTERPCLTIHNTGLPSGDQTGDPCDPICKPVENPLYRVTAKVVGSKNTVSYIQAFLS
jgi:Tfp pilus assembly protein PilX